MKLSGYQYNAGGGETFDSIAFAVFGKETYAAEIMSINPELLDKQYFTGGEAVLLPVIDIPDPDAAGIPETAPWKE